MPETIDTLSGTVAVIVFLCAYGALQLGLIRGSSLTFTLANLVASGLVLFGLLDEPPSPLSWAVLVWGLISLIGIVRITQRLRRLKFTEDEEAIRRELLPSMPRALARSFFDLGVWVDLDPGHSLTRQGAAVETLYCIRSGRAKVFSGGQDVGAITGGFVGEINVLDAQPASASVLAEDRMRAYAVDGEALRKQSARDSDFRMAIEAALSRDTGAKLQAANMRARASRYS